MKDWSNQAVFSVLGYNTENQNKHRLIGKVAFHVHKLVKVRFLCFEVNPQKGEKIFLKKKGLRYSRNVGRLS